MKKRFTHIQTTILITMYPHIYKIGDIKQFQAGILSEEILGVVNSSRIYSGVSINELVEELAHWRNEWKPQFTHYRIEKLQRVPEYQRVFGSLHGLLFGEVIDMSNKQYKEFEKRFNAKFYKK